MKRSYFGIVAMVVLVAVSLAFPVRSDAQFPSLTQLKQTNVALIVEGFRFASGMKENSQGNYNGQGFELVPATWVGSGFVAAADGSVVTNYHVASKALRIRAMFDDKSTYEINNLKGYSPARDLAILKISSDRPFPAVQLGDSNDVEPMNNVMAVGNPQGMGINITRGDVSRVHRDDYGNVDLVVHTAPIAQGNSGGSLYRGHAVIGVNTMILRGTQFNFAMPINHARRLLIDSGNNMVPLKEAFPTDPLVIAREKFESIEAGTHRVDQATSSNQPGIKKFRYQLHQLRDYMVWVESPGHDLAMVVTNNDGKIIAIGNIPNVGYEGIMLSNDFSQNVTINVLNYGPDPVRFGIGIGYLTWLSPRMTAR